MKICLVFYLISQSTGVWDRHLIYVGFCLQTVHHITSTPLSLSWQEDLFLWSYNDYGQYNIKYSYRLIVENYTSPMASPSSMSILLARAWKSLWKSKALPICKS